MNVKHSPILEGAYRFSVAPMMDCTDRHFRVLMRHITKRALLYSEMIVAKSLHYSLNRKKLLDFNEIEHPIALQIGGDDPKLLSEATRMAEAWGYDEINLNIGCPSSKVKAGEFGACLMANPQKVARCIEAMVNSSKLPVTIKHRIGIDNLDSDDFLLSFIDEVANAGAQRFSIHARKALLNGLNPKENRTIPPLDYEKVKRLKKKRSNLIIELNGGLTNTEECLKALEDFDGVMVGRAVYENPIVWNDIDSVFYGDKKLNINQSSIFQQLIPYAENHLKDNGKLWEICRHTLKLIKGIPRAKVLRHELSLNAQKSNADINLLEKVAQQLKDAGL